MQINKVVLQGTLSTIYGAGFLLRIHTGYDFKLDLDHERGTPFLGKEVRIKGSLAPASGTDKCASIKVNRIAAEEGFAGWRKK